MSELPRDPRVSIHNSSSHGQTSMVAQRHHHYLETSLTSLTHLLLRSKDCSLRRTALHCHGNKGTPLQILFIRSANEDQGEKPALWGGMHSARGQGCNHLCLSEKHLVSLPVHTEVEGREKGSKGSCAIRARTDSSHPLTFWQ